MFIKGFPLVSKQKEPRLVFHLFLAQTFKYLEIHDYLIFEGNGKTVWRQWKVSVGRRQNVWTFWIFLRSLVGKIRDDSIPLCALFAGLQKITLPSSETSRIFFGHFFSLGLNRITNHDEFSGSSHFFKVCWISIGALPISYTCQFSWNFKMREFCYHLQLQSHFNSLFAFSGWVESQLGTRKTKVKG